MMEKRSTEKPASAPEAAEKQKRRRHAEAASQRSVVMTEEVRSLIDTVLADPEFSKLKMRFWKKELVGIAKETLASCNNNIQRAKKEFAQRLRRLRKNGRLP